MIINIQKSEEVMFLVEREGGRKCEVGTDTLERWNNVLALYNQVQDEMMRCWVMGKTAMPHSSAVTLPPLQFDEYLSLDEAKKTVAGTIEYIQRHQLQ